MGEDLNLKPTDTLSSISSEVYDPLTTPWHDIQSDIFRLDQLALPNTYHHRLEQLQKWFTNNKNTAVLLRMVN